MIKVNAHPGVFRALGVVAVLFAHRLSDREPIADDGAERRDQVVVDLCRLGGHFRPSKVIVILG
jgi:hypothetical protein